MKTALYDHHIQLGAKMIDFAGWEMPLQYKGVIVEHQAVRQSLGIFDVSHMGRLVIQGPDAEKLLENLSANEIASHPPFSAIYTIWCNEKGGALDDVMLFKVSAEEFFVIVNASNRQKDLEHLLSYAKDWNVQLKDFFTGYGILALQGPKALVLMQNLYPAATELKPMHFTKILEDNEEILISRTGYTGAKGFEIFASNTKIVKLWEQLLADGQAYGIQPCGLGARDTLRLEMGFALYGHELTDTIAPIESVAAWTVKEKAENFIGKTALKDLEASGKKRFAYGVNLMDKGVPRQNYPVLKAGKNIGFVTSGSFSPTLNTSIALVLVNEPLELGEVVEVVIRQTSCKAQIVEIPFVRKNA